MTATAVRQAVGEYGERVALRHLLDQGMTLLDRNWRCASGELDLVMRDGNVLVACEVKTRTSEVCGSPHEAVDQTKLARLHELVWFWAEAHSVHPDRENVPNRIWTDRPGEFDSTGTGEPGDPHRAMRHSPLELQAGVERLHLPHPDPFASTIDEFQRSDSPI